MQFYRIASHPTNPDIMIGGTQDNGFIITYDGGNSWTQVVKGDGMECFFGYSDPNSIVYAAEQMGRLIKSTNGGNSFNFLYNLYGAWVAPFFRHPYGDTLYAANKSIYKKSPTSGFVNIAPNVSPELINAMAQSSVNPQNMIFAAVGNVVGVSLPDTTFLVKVSTDGGYNWTEVTDNIPGEARWISRVVTDPTEENTMYVIRCGYSEGNKIYKTTDLGETWTNASGDLPDIPCNDLFIDPENIEHYYVATDLGVYYSENEGLNWTYAGDGLPFVIVMDFDYVKIDNIRYLRIGTHGRSIYEAILPNFCLPAGITFTSQEQINNFQANYPYCTEIEGDVEIDGGDITNLNGLNALSNIGGDLFIGRNNQPFGGNGNLTNLVGLGNLTSIGGDLTFSSNDTLTILTGLESLVSIGGDLRVYMNDMLASFIGLDNLTSVEGDVRIGIIPYMPAWGYGNNSLTSLTGLENLTTIGGEIVIINNQALTSLTGLDNVIASSINNLSIHNNYVLSSCEAQTICDYLAAPTGTVNIYLNASGCNNPGEVAIACGFALPCLPYGNYYFLTQSEIDDFQTNYPGCPELLGDVQISGNDIMDLSELNVVTYIGGEFEIDRNDVLTSLTGLNNVTSIGGRLCVNRNNSLTNLTGFENLTSTGGDLQIGEWSGGQGGNSLLINLTGLDNVTSIGGALKIRKNNSLTNLSGLNNIEAFSITDIDIRTNPALSTCDVQSVCDYLSNPNGEITIEDNAPGCNSQQQVEDACEIQCLYDGITFSTQAQIDNFHINYPNCTEIEGAVEISGDDITDLDSLYVLTSIGGYLKIDSNDILTSLTGLENIDEASITDLTITNNGELYDCDVWSICQYLNEPGGTVLIENNAPECNSIEEVQEHCLTEIEEIVKTNGLRIIPNPMGSSSIITYTLESNSMVILNILDLSGREIVTLVNEVQKQGEQRVVFNTNDLPAGVYFCVLKTNERFQTKKLIKID